MTAGLRLLLGQGVNCAHARQRDGIVAIAVRSSLSIGRLRGRGSRVRRELSRGNRRGLRR